MSSQPPRSEDRSPLVLALDRKLSQGAVSRGLSRLYEEFLLPLVGRNAIQLRNCQQGFCARFGAFEVRAIGPTRNEVEQFNAQSAAGILSESLTWCRQRRGELNDLSVVLVLSHKSPPFHVLLGSDATLRAWPAALEFWQDQCTCDSKEDASFSAVKVSHHGASTGHYLPLYQRFCRSSATCALVSLGPGWEVAPDQQAINDIQDRGIDVYVTCRSEPCGNTRGGFPLPGEPVSADAMKSEPDEYCCYDVKVRLWSSGNVTVEPREALVVPRQDVSNGNPPAVPRDEIGQTPCRTKRIRD